MDRLTFMDNGKPAFRFRDCVYKNDVADKLYAYEDTGLTPEEITALKADNKRLHELIDEVENTIKSVEKGAEYKKWQNTISKSCGYCRNCRLM